MTSVDETHTGTERDFDAAYDADRGRLYRGLVLAVGNRDIAVEAIDRAFVKWQSRRPSRRGEPATEVFRSAYRWAARRISKPDRMIQGFRLQESEPSHGDEQLLRYFEKLDMVDRAILVGIHYLGWDAQRATTAVGIAAAEALPRASAAQSRLARAAGTSTEMVAAQLGGVLAAKADPMPEPLHRGDQVKGRAKWRRIGLLSSGVVGSVALVGAVAFGVQQIASDSSVEPSGTTATNGQTTNTNAEAATVFSADRLVWEQVPIPIQEGEISSIAYGPAGFVAIGQDWSAPNGQSITLLSEDGLIWDVAPGATQGRNSWVNQMTIAGDKYVVIGSSFNEFAGNESPFLSISDDGVNWNMIELPVESQIEINGQTMTVHTWVQQVAASGDQVIVMASQNIEFDPQILIEEALGDDLELENWGWSDRGIEIYSNRGDVQQIIAWEEVGIDEATISLITSGRPLIFSSSNLTDWETLTMEGVGSNHWISAMGTLGDSFAAVVYGDFGSTLWTSTDGSEWSEEDAIESGASISSLATINDRVIAVGTDATGNGAAWVSTDLETWDKVDIPLGSGWLQQIQVSDAGIAIVGQEDFRPTQQVEITVGDFTVQATQNGGFIVLDGDGNEVAMIGSRDVRYTDDGQIELDHPETGELIVAFDQQELDQAWELQWRQFEIEQQGNDPSYVLLVSETGDEWTRTDLAGAIGAGFSPNGIAVGPESIVMTGWREGGFVEDVFGGGSTGASLWVGTAP